MVETPSRPSTRRIALVGVALPAAIVLIDRLAWMRGGEFRGGELVRLVFFPWLAVKAGLLSWCAGRYLGATLYGWIVFFWSQALLDVHTFGASQGAFGYELDALTHTLISAQIGFLTVWTFLSTAPMPWRVTSFLVAIAAIIVQSRSLDTNWRYLQMPLVQWIAAIVVVLVCVALRVAGFTVRQVSSPAGTNGRKHGESFQFGVKHMLAWTTALAPLLVVLRGLDDLSLREFSVQAIYPAAVLSLCIALVTIASVWLALGAGYTAIRIVATAAIVGGTGLVLYQLARKWGPATFTWNWNADRLLILVVDMGALWWAWLGLLGALLAGMLLFLRAAGYRLAKLRRLEAALPSAHGN